MDIMARSNGRMGDIICNMDSTRVGTVDGSGDMCIGQGGWLRG